MRTIGWAKDAVAFVCFCITLFIVVRYNNKICKQRTVVVLLCLCAIVDGLFTANPHWHCECIGFNAPTGVVVTAFVVFLAIVVHELMM